MLEWNGCKKYPQSAGLLVVPRTIPIPGGRERLYGIPCIHRIPDTACRMNVRLYRNFTVHYTKYLRSFQKYVA